MAKYRRATAPVTGLGSITTAVTAVSEQELVGTQNKVSSIKREDPKPVIKKLAINNFTIEKINKNLEFTDIEFRQKRQLNYMHQK